MYDLTESYIDKGRHRAMHGYNRDYVSDLRNHPFHGLRCQTESIRLDSAKNLLNTF